VVSKMAQVPKGGLVPKKEKGCYREMRALLLFIMSSILSHLQSLMTGKE
jgi:hypothetical protein